MSTINSSIKSIPIARWLALAFVAMLFSLHFIKPEVDPSWNFISEYQVGRFGWVMQLAFISLGMSCFLLAAGIWKEVNIAGKIGLVLLLITGCGMLIGGIFKTDALNTVPELQTLSGKLHQVGAMLDQVPFAAILITIALFRKQSWKQQRVFLILTLLAVWFGLVYFVASVQAQFPADGVFGPDVVVGWQSRLMITTQALWIVFIAYNFERKLKAEYLSVTSVPVGS